jgi:tripartite-type tricarboxylate transporter receptor subunit TctC
MIELIRRRKQTCFLCTVAVVSSLSARSAQAADDGSFFKGKIVQIVVGFEAGGGYDLYARLLSRYLPKYLSGHPSVVVQNMSGAGSRVAANWLYNVAPRDGTALGVIVQTTAFDQAMRAPGVQFDVTKFNWIGNPIVDNEIILGWKPAGYGTMQDVLSKKGMVCGGTGTATPTVILPLVINHLTPAEIRIVPGYPGGASISLAMERGEISCFGGDSWSSAKASMSSALKAGKLSVLVQFGTKSEQDIAAYEGHDVPLASSFARTDLERKVLDLIDSQFEMGRPLLGPPGVPAARVAALRMAFDEMMRDPELLADAAGQRMEISPASGSRLQALAAEIGSAAPDVLALASRMTDPSSIK